MKAQKHIFPFRIKAIHSQQGKRFLTFFSYSCLTKGWFYNLTQYLWENKNVTMIYYIDILVFW